MRINFWNSLPAIALLCGGLAPLGTEAQQAASSIPSAQTALKFPAADGGSSPAAPAAADPAAAPATDPAATTTSSSANVSVPVSQDMVIKELAEMKARIAELESVLKARSGATDAADAEKDASALRSAEGGDGGQTTPAATPAPAAAPAPAPAPDISAETTTKSAPMPGDWTWLNSGGHNVDSPMSTKYFTPEFRADANYILDYNHPVDDTMGGSTEMFRSQEWQVEQISVGGDIRIQNTRGRILFMNGLWATTTPRNDASYNRGQWQLSNAYRYVSEAWGGYHWDVSHGLNVDAGIFVSYIGLFSYYNFDNWAYQPSYVSSNTPWFFNGLRIQWWPTEKLKIEPWIINGWQSYARYNSKPGLGGQILWRPKPYLDFVWNDYGMGEDDAGYPGRSRIHADYSTQVKFYDKPKNFLDKAAFTVTGDLGCEYGGGPAAYAITGQTSYSPQGLSPETGTSSDYVGGVNCHNSKDGKPKQEFEGWMSYFRTWYKKDLYAVTLGGGQMNNPGRYLTLLPPINGATATSGTPYFTENGGDRAQMHDGTITFDYMPSQFITFRLEQSYRWSDVPYYSGHGGITPPGGNNGNPADYQCAAGGDSGYGYVSTNTNTGIGVAGLPLAIANCQAMGLSNGFTNKNDLRAIWWPDLRRDQNSTMVAILVRF